MSALGDEIDKARARREAREAEENKGLLSKSIDFYLNNNFNSSESFAIDRFNKYGTVGNKNVIDLFKDASREFVNTYADDNDSLLQSAARNIERSNTYINYMMSNDEKLRNAQEIEKEIGIDAQAILQDNDNFKKAMEIYEYEQQRKKLVPEGDFDIDKLYDEIPGLRDLAGRDAMTAAQVLHNIDDVRTTNGIIDSFTKMLEIGNDELKYKNLAYKDLRGIITDDEAREMKAIQSRMRNNVTILPSFYDNPLATIAGGLAGSLPVMGQSTLEAVKEGGIAGIIGAGAAVGVAIALGQPELVPGLAVKGFQLGAGVGSRAGIAIKGFGIGAKLGARIGMFEGMMRPESGQYYQDFKDMTNEKGERILTDNEARAIAVTAGSLNAGIEMANFNIVEDALRGSAYNKVIKNIVQGAVDRETAWTEVKMLARENIRKGMKVAVSEELEEGAQSIADDIVHNSIEWYTGDRSNKVYDVDDMGNHAAGAMLEALPGSIGFGMLGGVGGSLGASMGLSKRTINNLQKNDTWFDKAVRKTNIGNAMVMRLQQAAAESKLSKTNPAALKEVIHSQLAGKGYETMNIDVGAILMDGERGVKNLQEIAKAANISDEKVRLAIETKGFIAVPTESFSQSAATSEALEAVTYDVDGISIARMKEEIANINQKFTIQAQRDIEQQFEQIDNIANELFPDGGINTKLARAAIIANISNPAKGWKNLHNNLKVQQDAILAPALAALQHGAVKGTNIIEIKEDYGRGGTGYRVSENDFWYQKFYKTYGRAPTKLEFENMARALIAGEADAPKVDGWIPPSIEEAEAMKASIQELDAINDKLRALEAIKETMKTVNSAEMNLTKGLSKEGFSVYRDIMRQLQKVGGKTKTTAKLNAILFARRADRYAEVMTEMGGEKYTAKDYYNKRFGGIRFGDKAINNTDGLKQAMNRDVNIEKQVPIMDITDYLPKGKMTNKEILDFVRDLIKKDKKITTADNKAVISILPKDVRHITYSSNKNVSHKELAIRGKAISNISELLKNAVLIESMPNHKKDKKPKVRAYHRFYVPLNLNGKISTIRIVAEEQNNIITLNPTDVNLYDVIIEKKRSHPANTIQDIKSSTGTRQPIASSKISIREMLSGVNDANGKPYIENLTQYNQTTNKSIHGSIDIFEDGKRIINIFETADESTFLHEIGHMFLMDLEDLAALGHKQSIDDLQTINNWADWNQDAWKKYVDTPWADEFKIRQTDIIAAEKNNDTETAERLKNEWRQESFARAFERYLHTGNAPTTVLKGVFRKFKKFLQDIYIGFISIGGKASKDVEAVMARMIATNEEIEEASLDEKYKDFQKAGGKKLLNETEQETYMRWEQEAKDEAKEELLKYVMKDLSGKAKTRQQQQIDKERAIKRAELENLKIFAVHEAVKQTGSTDIVTEFYDSVEEYQKELTEAGGDLETVLNKYMADYEAKINEKAISDKVTEEEAQKIIDDGIYNKKKLELEYKALARKDASIRRISAKTENAFDELLNTAKSLPEDIEIQLEKEDKLVKRLVKDIARLEVSAKWDSKALKEIQYLLEIQDKSTLVAAINKFREQMKETKVNAKIIEEAAAGKFAQHREYAKTTIAKLPISEAASVLTYSRNERTHARHVRMMMAAGNWQQAMRSKEQQLLSLAMKNEAKKIQEEVEKLVKQVKQQASTRTVKLPALERYWHNHLAYKLGLIQKDAIKPKTGIQPFSQIFKGLNKSLDIEELPTDILNVIDDENFNGYRSLNINELKEAARALRVLYVTGRDKFKLKTIDGKEISDAVEEILTDKTASNKAKMSRKKVNDDTGGMGYSDWIGKLPEIGPIIAQKTASYLMYNIKPELLISLLGKKAHKYIYQTIEKASNDEAVRTGQAVNEMRNILSRYSHTEKRAWKKKNIDLDDNEKITKENIMCMALNLGNETNTARLCMGLDMKEADVRKIVETNMTEKDWETVQAIWNHIDSYWEDTAKVEELLNGVHLEKVQAKPFKVKIGDSDKVLDIKGGYYPIKYNAEKSSFASENEINEAARGTMQGAQVLGMNREFTKGRSKNKEIAIPLKLKFSVVNDHIGKVIHNIAYRVPCRDVYRLINSQAFKKHVESTMGMNAYKFLKEWATDCWAQPAQGGLKLIGEGVFGWLRRNSTMAIMGWRAYPAIENITNIAGVMEQLGAKKALQAVAAYYSNKGNSKLIQKSIFMSDRINSLDRDIRSQSGLFDAAPKGIEFMRNHAYDMMIITDLILSKPTWVQAYKDSYGQNLKAVADEMNELKNTMVEKQAETEKVRAEIYDLQTRLQTQLSIPDRVNVQHELKEKYSNLYRLEDEYDKIADQHIMNDMEQVQEAEQRSVLAADKVIRENFGSGNVKDLATIQKGGELLKCLTVFYSYFNMTANAIAKAYYKGKYNENGGIGRWTPLAKAVMYRIILTSIMVTMLKMVLTGDGNDDKDKYGKDDNGNKIEKTLIERFLKELGKNTISTAVGTLYGIRDIGNLLITLAFDGTDYGRGVNPISIAMRPAQSGYDFIKMINTKINHDEKAELEKAKKEAKFAKMSVKQKKAWLEKQKYKGPDKNKTWLDISKAGAQTVVSFTANSTGITNTVADGVFTIMQYMSDDRYDATIANGIWSVLFDKKPILKKPPEKPKKLNNGDWKK